MKKDLIIKIVVSIIIIIGSIFVVRFLLSEKETSDNGTITFQVIDKNETMVINDKLTFKKGDTTFKILNEHYNIRSSNDYGSTFIYDIEDVKTDGFEYFFTLYVNGEMSMYGIDQIELTDGMILCVKVTKYDPNYAE